MCVGGPSSTTYSNWSLCIILYFQLHCYLTTSSFGKIPKMKILFNFLLTHCVHILHVNTLRKA